MKERNLLRKLEHVTPNPSSINRAMANLWRLTLKDLRITENIPGILANYNRRYRKHATSNDLINSSTMKQNVFADEMSLKSLVALLSNLLNVKRITITITLTHHTGKPTSVSEVLYDKEHKLKEKGKGI